MRTGRAGKSHFWQKNLPRGVLKRSPVHLLKHIDFPLAMDWVPNWLERGAGCPPPPWWVQPAARLDHLARAWSLAKKNLESCISDQICALKNPPTCCFIDHLYHFLPKNWGVFRLSLTGQYWSRVSRVNCILLGDPSQKKKDDGWLESPRFNWGYKRNPLVLFCVLGCFFQMLQFRQWSWSRWSMVRGWGTEEQQCIAKCIPWKYACVCDAQYFSTLLNSSPKKMIHLSLLSPLLGGLILGGFIMRGTYFCMIFALIIVFIW